MCIKNGNVSIKIYTSEPIHGKWSVKQVSKGAPNYVSMLVLEGNEIPSYLHKQLFYFSDNNLIIINNNDPTRGRLHHRITD